MKALRIVRGILLALALIVCVVMWVAGVVVVGYTWPVVVAVGIVSVFCVAIIDLYY